MASYKVGDKARIVNVTYAPHVQYNGMVVTIDGPMDDSFVFFYGTGAYPISGLPADAPRRASPEFLAPLEKPQESADTWAADKVKQVTKPQHIEPVVERDRVAAD